MKATGIVRRVDDLGRIVIPKEIRRTLKIREGDPSLTTLTPIDRFCLAIHSLAQKNNSGVNFTPLFQYSKPNRKVIILPQLLLTNRQTAVQVPPRSYRNSKMQCGNTGLRLLVQRYRTYIFLQHCIRWYM